MRPGDVLVAGTTTPAWTPLFARAAAVVTDIGGPLSHGSIVAREYGIPAVMGTGVATRRIRNGQTVTVEGTATMYSGGFFAGTTGTKFYLEDETGGIQVYCPGARDLVEVAVGDQVELRFDDNQGYTVEQALRFIDLTLPARLELIEQPTSQAHPETAVNLHHATNPAHSLPY